MILSELNSDYAANIGCKIDYVPEKAIDKNESIESVQRKVSQIYGKHDLLNGRELG